MRMLIALVIAAAVAEVIWQNYRPFPKASTVQAAASISYWGAHNRAHIEELPVQHFEDLSLVFTERGDNPAPAARLVLEHAKQRQ